MGQYRPDLRKENKHVRSYRKQLESAAWRDLSGSAAKVMLAMGLFEDGNNNGTFFFSDRTGAEKTGLSRNTVQKAIKELIGHGFIYCSQKGGFSRKTPHAAQYGFTWLAGPKGEHRAPTHAYEKWTPDGNTRAQLLTETGSVSTDELETPGDTGPINEPAEMEKALVSVIPYSSDIEPQTVSQGIGSASAETEQRKQANLPSWALSAFPSDDLADLRRLTAEHLTGGDAGSQSRLAKHIGCPPGTFSKFINGRNLPEQYRAALADAIRETRYAA